MRVLQLPVGALALCLALVLPFAHGVDPGDYEESLRGDEQPREESSTQYPNGVNVIPGQADIHYPIYAKIPRSAFSCIGKEPGFYADTELRCQVWHTCDQTSVQQSFLCTNGTIYSQENRVCDWWYNVNCDPEEVNRHTEANKDLYKGPPPKKSHHNEDQEDNRADPEEYFSTNKKSHNSPPRPQPTPSQRQDRRPPPPPPQQQRSVDQQRNADRDQQRNYNNQNSDNQQQRQRNNQESNQRQAQPTPPASGVPEKKRVIVLRLPGPLPPGATIPPHILMQYAESILAAEKAGKKLPPGVTTSQVPNNNHQEPQKQRRPPPPPPPPQPTQGRPSQPPQQKPTARGPIVPYTARPFSKFLEEASNYNGQTKNDQQQYKSQPEESKQQNSRPYEQNRRDNEEPRSTRPPPPPPPPQPTQQRPVQPPQQRPTPRGPIVPYTARPFSKFLEEASQYNGQTKTQPPQQRYEENEEPRNSRPPPPSPQRPTTQRPTTQRPTTQRPTTTTQRYEDEPQRNRDEEPSYERQQPQRPSQQQPQRQQQQPQRQQQQPQRQQQQQQRPSQQQQRQEQERRQHLEVLENYERANGESSQSPRQRYENNERDSYNSNRNEYDREYEQPSTAKTTTTTTTRKPTTAKAAKQSSPNHYEDPHKKFRHSTPRKHGDVKFASRSQAAYEDEEQQFPEESRRPAYPFQLNNFHSVPHHQSATYSKATEEPEVYSAKKTQKSRYHVKESFETAAPLQKENVPTTRFTTTTSTTVRPYVAQPKVEEDAGIKRLVVVARQGLKIKAPHPQATLKITPVEDVPTNSEESYTLNAGQYDSRKVDSTRNYAPEVTTTTTSTEAPRSVPVRVTTRRVIKKKKNSFGEEISRVTLPVGVPVDVVQNKKTENAPPPLEIYGGEISDAEEEEELIRAAALYHQASEHYGKRKRPLT